MGFKFNIFTGDFDLVGGTSTNSFATIQPDLGTSPTAASAIDTLTLTSSDSSITITGNSSTDTINFQLNGSTNPNSISLTNTHILVGNSSNKAADVAMSGDVSVTNTGSTTVGTVGGSSSTNIHTAELAANAATNANTVSTIVKRDSSGNFIAGTITAALTGTASGNTTYTANNHGVVISSATNAMTVIAPDSSTTKVLKSGGSSADPSWLNYDNANTVSTLVFRDSSGNFSAGTVTASVTGHSSLDLALTGGTMSGAIDMGSHQINSVTDPTSAQDAATKNYVDTVASSLQTIQAVTAASTANIAGTYNNGVAGVGATFTTTSTGTFTLDGVTPSLTQRILIKDQSGGNGFQNGVYNFTVLPVNGVSGAVFTRALDYNTGASIDAGDLIPVINGTVNATTSWLQTATVTNVGTDALVFTQWTANPSNYLLKANNLSDVSSTSTSFNNISGMTTLGDTIYGDTSGARGRLAGNTSATKNFLTQTGNGSISAAPAWSTIAAGDVPSLDTSKLTSGTLPIVRGGTNSAATLSNNRVMQSSGGAIVEASAITANRALISDANGIPTHSVTTNTELTYVNGVTSAIQTQINTINNDLAIYLYGDGSDGALTISSGTTTLTRDMYYSSITITSTAIINPSGWKIFCSGTIDISGAGAGAIALNGTAGGNGGATGTAGTLGSSPNSTNTLANHLGTAGAAGGTGAGAQATANAGPTGFGGLAGNSGAGGSGSGGAGGASRSASAAAVYIPRRYINEFIRGATLMGGGSGGPGGGSGGGDGSNNGGGGGGGGSPGGPIYISCLVLATGSNSTAAVIQSKGAKGGNGGSTAAGNTGGGGGAGGGGGGAIYIAYGSRTGSTITNGLDVSSGAGGDGGGKTGTGVAGNGAASGAGGTIIVINIGAGTSTTTTGSGSNSASGGTGGGAVTTQVNL